MEGFYLLCGHLLGDYVLQNDWMASWKTAPAGKTTGEEDAWVMSHHGDPRMHAISAVQSWAGMRPALACTAHCLLYTLAVWLCSFWWMPLWGLLACFATHWPIDRFRLARRWMSFAGQEKFATGPLSPWSIIVVDNTIHLLTLAVIAAVAGRY